LNTKYVVIVAAMAVMLIGATAFATDSVFADGKKKYKKSQTAYQDNACGNGKLPMKIYCQNILSQLQGDGNAVNVIGVQ
jgi:hypothetical protein